MQEYSKPKVTIDLEEYQSLLKIIKEYEESREEIVLDVHRALITGLLQVAQPVPGFSVKSIINQVIDTMNDQNKDKIIAIDIIHTEGTTFVELAIKYKNEDGEVKRTIRNIPGLEAAN